MIEYALQVNDVSSNVLNIPQFTKQTPSFTDMVTTNIDISNITDEFEFMRFQQNEYISSEA